MPKSLDLHNERLQAIELLLRWEGEVSNARLRELFGIHSTHASRLIAAYRDAHPHGIQADIPRKRFVPAELEAEPVYDAGGLDAYVGLLERTGAPPPGLLMLRTELADIAPCVFAPVRQAIRERHGIEVLYRSMTHPEPHVRRLFPHACVHTQGRWHVRAYCAQAREFRDFVLGRMAQVRPIPEPSPLPSVNDQAWQQIIELVVEPHSALTPAQTNVVREEHFRGGQAMVRTVRAALAQYVLHELRIASDPQQQRPPDYLLMLRNAATVRPWLFGSDHALSLGPQTSS